MQYSLVENAARFGWQKENILIIDDDLGVSGASAAGRQGFQRLLAEIALDHVGLILGVDMSRLARSCADWHHLLELCARFGTLIADLDGLYDPSQFNDRMLLGLKGTMSEAELHILRQRLFQGKVTKARRAELAKSVPTGYLKLPDGDVIMDPDEEAQTTVRRVFSEYARTHSVHGVVASLARSNALFGIRERCGLDKGSLKWGRPHRGRVIEVLTNPIYAGAYVYGLRQSIPQRQIPGKKATGRSVRLREDEWLAFVPNKYPAYISWQTFNDNQRLLQDARERFLRLGPSGGGRALLGGLIFCGRCGNKMVVQYSKRRGAGYARYHCCIGTVNYGHSPCWTVSHRTIDLFVESELLRSLESNSIDICVRIAENLNKEWEDEKRGLESRLRRSRYSAAQAERHYKLVDPENRMVANALEKDWESRLRDVREIEREQAEFEKRKPSEKDDGQAQSARLIALELAQVWHSSELSIREKKEVMRLVIERVIICPISESELVEITVMWKNGNATRGEVHRPVGKLRRMQGHEKLIATIKSLRTAGYTCAEIARKVNEEGWHTPNLMNGYNERLIQVMLERYGRVPRGPRRQRNDDPNLWRLSELADELQIPRMTVYGWLKRGWVKALRYGNEWAVQADTSELQRLKELRVRLLTSRPKNWEQAPPTWAVPHKGIPMEAHDER